jgi:hypothetical protein
MNDTPAQVNLEGDTHAVAGWIWKNLVPKSGQANTVQGELLRAVEKLSWEAQNNGNGNWDVGFEKLTTFLRATLGAEHRLSAQMQKSVRRDLDTLSNFEEPYIEDDLYDRLTEAVVAYCRLNPVLIAKSVDPNQYR